MADSYTSWATLENPSRVPRHCIGMSVGSSKECFFTRAVGLTLLKRRGKHVKLSETSRYQLDHKKRSDTVLADSFCNSGESK